MFRLRERGEALARESRDHTSDDRSPPSDPQRKSGVIMASGRRQHTLLVEEDEDTLSVTAAMLEHPEYTARAEAESLKALRIFSEEPHAFNLAILEALMPQLSGPEPPRRI